MTILSAIENRNNANAGFVLIGDSVDEGAVGPTSINNRMVSQANTLLRTMYPTTANGSGGGLGFINMTQTCPATTWSSWPIQVTGTPGWSDTPLGPVRMGWSMSGPGSWTWATPSNTTSIRVMYYATGDGGQLTVTGGSGGPVTITDSVSGSDGALSVSIPVAGAQTITIAQASGGVFISGVIHYAGDENNGVGIHACGHYGWKASDWPGTHGFSGFPSFPSNGVLDTAWWGLFLGINDCQSVNAATFLSNMEALITEIQGFSPMSGQAPFIVIPYQPNVSFVDGGGWAAYASALHTLAANIGSPFVADLNAHMPSVASAGSEYYFDTVHLNNAGALLAAQILVNAMPAPPKSGGLLLTGAMGMGF